MSTAPNDNSSSSMTVPSQPGARPAIEHHTREWSSGSRGGGKVPADFGWRTNPKQWQEEYGANEPQGPIKPSA